MGFIAVLFLALVAICGVFADDDSPVVTIDDGQLRGTNNVTDEGTSFASFRGIPYAEPPTGENRFQEPVAITSWSGVYNATSYSSQCKQYNPVIAGLAGSEDCLYLNVLTSKVDETALLPVIVFIHGGAFLFGSGDTYDPTRLLNEKVVVVTFNFRLGPFGFLSTGDDVIPGNAGLKDQALVLQWVQKNIKQFGGDPDNVTLLGHATGGASAHLHYISPRSINNFARGAALSGTALDAWCFSYNPVDKAVRLAALLGCSTDSSTDILKCLNEADADDIANGQMQLTDSKVQLFSPFRPCIESENVTNPFLTEYPYTATKNGKMQKLPLIVSITCQDGLFPMAAYEASDELLPYVEANFDELASSEIFQYNDTLPADQRSSVAEKIREKYLGGEAVSQETFAALVQAATDRNFGVGASELAQLHATLSGEPVYFYRYCYRGNYSLSEILSGKTTNYGVSHADDILHVFYALGLRSDLEGDTLMTERIISTIYNYASTGEPKITEDLEWQTVETNTSDIRLLEISSPTDLEMKTISDLGFASFWNNLGFNENANYK